MAKHEKRPIQVGPLLALVFVASCASGVAWYDKQPNPNRAVPIKRVPVTIKAPGEDFTGTLQLRSRCSDVDYETFTVSSAAWRRGADVEKDLPIIEGGCTMGARMLPSQDPWVELEFGDACTVELTPELKASCS